MALDVICRITLYYSKHDAHNNQESGQCFIDKVMEIMPDVINKALMDPNIGAKGMFADMRFYLNEINKGNGYIESLPITTFGVESQASMQELPFQRKITGASWLDISKEKVSIYIPEKDVLVKFSFHLIKFVYFAENTNCMQVTDKALMYLLYLFSYKNNKTSIILIILIIIYTLLYFPPSQISFDNTPDKIEELLQPEELSTKNKAILFYIDFPNKEVCITN